MTGIIRNAREEGNAATSTSVDGATRGLAIATNTRRKTAVSEGTAFTGPVSGRRNAAAGDAAAQLLVERREASRMRRNSLGEGGREKKTRS